MKEDNGICWMEATRLTKNFIIYLKNLCPMFTWVQDCIIAKSASLMPECFLISLYRDLMGIFKWTFLQIFKFSYMLFHLVNFAWLAPRYCFPGKGHHHLSLIPPPAVQRWTRRMKTWPSSRPKKIFCPFQNFAPDFFACSEFFLSNPTKKVKNIK